MRPTLRELGTGLVAYSPLGRGYLSGRFTSPDELDVNDWRRTQPRFRRKNAGRNAARGGALRAQPGERELRPVHALLLDEPTDLSRQPRFTAPSRPSS